MEPERRTTSTFHGWPGLTGSEKIETDMVRLFDMLFLSKSVRHHSKQLSCHTDINTINIISKQFHCREHQTNHEWEPHFISVYVCQRLWILWLFSHSFFLLYPSFLLTFCIPSPPPSGQWLQQLLVNMERISSFDLLEGNSLTSKCCL